MLSSWYNLKHLRGSELCVNSCKIFLSSDFIACAPRSEEILLSLSNFASSFVSLPIALPVFLGFIFTKALNYCFGFPIKVLHVEITTNIIYGLKVHVY